MLGAGPAQLGLLAAARRRGLAVVAADRDPAAPGFRYANRRALVPVDDEPALERLARADRVDGIVAPGSDRTPPVAARIAAKLGLPHPLRPEVAHRLASRQRERVALVGAGFTLSPGIVCGSLHEVRVAAERVGFPCTLTALDRPAGAGVAASAPRELALSLALATADSRVGACLVEELAGETLLVVVGFVLAGTLHGLLVAEAAVEGPVWLAAAPRAAVTVAQEAAAAVGIESGPVEVRVAVRGDEVRLVSVAARLGRCHEPELCRAAVGVDLNEIALRTALAEPLAADELARRRRAGAACIRLLPPAAADAAPAELEAAFAVPGVVGIRTYRGRDRGGAILAAGGDRDAALAAASRAAALLRLESVDAQAVA